MRNTHIVGHSGFLPVEHHVSALHPPQLWVEYEEGIIICLLLQLLLRQTGRVGHAAVQVLQQQLLLLGCAISPHLEDDACVRE